MTDVKGASGKTYQPTRGDFPSLDGFLFAGTRDEPLEGEAELTIQKVVNKGENTFLIAHVLSCKGKLMVSNREEEKDRPLKAGMTIGMGSHAAIGHIFAGSYEGKNVLVRYGKTAKNPKTKRVYRIVEAFVETPANGKTDEIPF